MCGFTKKFYDLLVWLIKGWDREQKQLICPPIYLISYWYLLKNGGKSEDCILLTITSSSLKGWCGDHSILKVPVKHTKKRFFWLSTLWDCITKVKLSHLNVNLLVSKDSVQPSRIQFMKGIQGLRSHEKGTWKHFIIPFPFTFTVQLNDLHHWVPKQPASISRQGWLKIMLWNDIKLVKHFSAYGIGQGVPYFTPAANFSPLLSSFLQFSWGKSFI